MGLYAAYGSNMDPTQMLRRCPSSPHTGTGWIRGWRLTFVGGKRFAKTFEVTSNTDYEFVVKALDGPLDGVAVNDMFLVEDINSAEPIK